MTGTELLIAKAAREFNYTLSKTNSSYELAAGCAEGTILKDATLKEVINSLTEVGRMEQLYGKPTYTEVNRG